MFNFLWLLFLIYFQYCGINPSDATKVQLNEFSKQTCIYLQFNSIIIIIVIIIIIIIIIITIIIITIYTGASYFMQLQAKFGNMYYFLHGSRQV